MIDDDYFIGKKFGRLLVIKPTDKYNKNYNNYLCCCECEKKTEIIVSGYNLKIGLKQSCGCIGKENISRAVSKDLTGQKFNRLLVVERIPLYNGGKQTYYRCICDCGEEILTRGNFLKSGHTKSCGCYHKERLKENSKDLTGMIFNRLYVIERLPLYKHKQTYYRCICDCGEETITSGTQLLSGNTKSCGCYHREISASRTGFLNPIWKGGVTALDIPLYDTYSDKLEPIEETRRDPNNYDFLQVKCTYCGRWIIPSRIQTVARVGFINGRDVGENRFYCNDGNCKKECPIYGQIKYPKGFLDNSFNREVQPELRKLCFERDNYECQRCGATKNLHCHHFEGILYNPLESADLDMVITVCVECHNFIHSQIGCGYSDLRCEGGKIVK